MILVLSNLYLRGQVGGRRALGKEMYFGRPRGQRKAVAFREANMFLSGCVFQGEKGKNR